MKTTEARTNPQLTLRTGQGLRQRYILTGISVLLAITAGILYWMLQQPDARAEVKKPEVKQEEQLSAKPVTIHAEIDVQDNAPVLRWEGEFPAGSMFVIEKAVDGNAWELVQRVPKEEVMIAVDRYRFSDAETTGSNVRYRLSCLDAAGALLTTEELETGLTASAEQLLTITGIEPMTFANHFTINLEAAVEEPISFELLDNNANPVYSEVYKVVKGENLIGFTRGDKLPPGVYIIRLSGSDDATAMTKLVKQ
jgi:hypothetical protein